MDNLALDECANKHTNEPDALFIHTPTVIQASPWNAWAQRTLQDLLRYGWRERRLGSSVHALHPFMGDVM